MDSTQTQQGGKCRETYPMRPATLARFIDKVEEGENGCVVWTAARSVDGYGRFHNGRLTAAHRVSYQHFVRPIGPDLSIDHLCRNKSCVNPEHLEAVPIEVNIRRKYPDAKPVLNERGVLQCPRGHEVIGENEHIDLVGTSRCRICRREVSKRMNAVPTPCPDCGDLFTAGNLARHRQRKHAILALMDGPTETGESDVR